MSKLQTNRDLYLAVESLVSRFKSNSRSLEQFLLALLRATEPFSSSECLSLDDFYGLISESFTIEPYQFEHKWLGLYDQFPTESSDFDGWCGTLKQQIVDLHEMEECGALENKYRSLGIQSPRGSQWYNFVPVDYLECAMAGSIEDANIDEFSLVTWEQFKGFIYCGQIYE
ncbi:MAG: hypothetical protein COA78_06695 [Blastopirellula sp.]|nr:MAG: hypothetical protein COA78_06695 [Blastopirellula sp.]